MVRLIPCAEKRPPFAPGQVPFAESE